MSESRSHEFPLPDNLQVADELVEDVLGDLKWPDDGGISMDLFQIDQLSSLEFHEISEYIEKAYYYELKLQRRTQAQLDQLRRAAYTYQMAGFMRQWAGSVRDEWIKIKADKHGPVYNITYDSITQDYQDIIQNLDALMMSNDKETDNWIRASIVRGYVKSSMEKGRNGYNWARMRMMYDMYATAFMDD